jgi:hypothetical protein
MKKTKVIVQVINGGFEQIFIDGENVEVYVVDEGCPDDRIYRMTLTPDPAAVEKLLMGNIGHKDDDRHNALEHKINCFIEGKPHLTIVETV